jgi:hypothetical protein
MWMIRGPPRAPDRLLESFGTRALRSEVFETMMGACGPFNSGGSATAGIRAHTWIFCNITCEKLQKEFPN